MREFLIFSVISAIMFVAGYYTRVFISWMQSVDEDIEDNEYTEY
jgi:hypothetical protein